MDELPDRFVTVYYKDGSAGYAVGEDVFAIDTALMRLAGDGDTRFTDDELRDSVVRMTALNGSPIVMLASFIVGYSISTRANRRRRKLHDRLIDDEVKDLDVRPPQSARKKKAPTT